MLTLEEIERRAYIEGNTALAALVAVVDDEIEEIKEQEEHRWCDELKIPDEVVARLL